MRNKRKRGRITSFVMVFAMSLSMLCGVATSSLQVKAAAIVSNPRIADDGTVTWDKITFGSYYQDAEYTVEPIKWRILDIDSEGNAFLIADEALDCKRYNEQGVEKINDDGIAYIDYSCTWENCTLRAWLNGIGDYENDNCSFINAAFTDDEKRSIIETTVANNSNPLYNTIGGNDTKDKIYLLSIEEASDTSYGFDSVFEEESKSRQAKATDFSRINGAENSSDYVENCSWWLRTLTKEPYYASFVYLSGFGLNIGQHVNIDKFAVRPVLNVNLYSSFVKDAGSVTSEGTIIAQNNITDSGRYSKPTIADGVTTWDCVYFGSYKQKATVVKKPIEWRVLSVIGAEAFIVADKALDCKQYNIKSAKCTWETCTLRAWLNGIGDYENDNCSFINEAFTDDEKRSIIETTVVNNDNPYHKTRGGNNTKDKIHLLSIEEVSNTSYGFDAEFGEKTNTRKVQATDYARINGVRRINSTNCENDCNWWLRSPGETLKDAVIVNEFGTGNYYGYFVHEGNLAVRPALRVNLSSNFVNYSGTISSNGILVTAEEIKSQKEVDEVINLISVIGTVTKDSMTSIDSARNAYNALSDDAKAKVTNYSVLQVAESKYAELIKDTGSGNSSGENGTTGNNTTSTTPVTTETGNTPAITETSKDNLTTFNIKNKKTYKKSKKVTIKDEDGIKSVVLNAKKIKVKMGKKSVSFKLSSYKKNLKKKNKWNKISVTDVNGNKKTIQFKIK